MPTPVSNPTPKRARPTRRAGVRHGRPRQRTSTPALSSGSHVDSDQHVSIARVAERQTPDLGVGARPDGGCRRMSNDAADVGVCVHAPDVQCRRITLGNERCVRSVCERASRTLFQRTGIEASGSRTASLAAGIRTEEDRSFGGVVAFVQFQWGSANPSSFIDDVKHLAWSHGEQPLRPDRPTGFTPNASLGPPCRPRRLQNWCAGESSQTGSVHVRLRKGFYLGGGRSPACVEAWVLARSRD